MSSPQDNSPSSQSGAGSGIRLPPISFLSGHSNSQGPSRLPPASNIGISRFLNAPSPPKIPALSPSLHSPHQSILSEGQEEKRPKLELLSSTYSSDHIQHSLQYSPYLNHYLPNSTQPSSAPQPERVPDPSHQKPPQEDKENELNPHHHHHHHHHHHPSHNNGTPHHHHHHHHHHRVNDQQKAAASSNQQLPHLHSQESLQKDPITTTTPSPLKERHEIMERSKLESPPKEVLSPVLNQEEAQLQHVQEEELQSKSIRKKTKRPVPFPPVVLNTEPIKELIKEYFPSRKFIGTIVYNPTTTWETLHTSQLYGLKPEHHERFHDIKEAYLERVGDPQSKANVRYIPLVPPLSNDNINGVLEVKIASRHIHQFKRSFETTVIHKRDLWGGASGVYSDDSDVLSVLAHLGLFSNSVDLKEWNPQWTPQDLISTSAQEGDLSVQLLLLPNLPEYHGYYANGINSRSWIGVNKHTGLSYAIINIKWESPGSYLGDSAIFKRYRSEVIQDTKANDELFEEQRGWRFNYKYYKQLKKKYESERDEKEKNIAGNGDGTTPSSLATAEHAVETAKS